MYDLKNPTIIVPICANLIHLWPIFDMPDEVIQLEYTTNVLFLFYFFQILVM